MSRRLIWLFVLGVGLSLAALVASSDQDAIATILRHDTASLALKISLLVFVGGHETKTEFAGVGQEG